MAQEQSMWGSIWDGVLETGGELMTDVTDFGKDWLGVKIDKEADRVQSSNPDEQRKHNNDYQQPTGEPVYTSAFAGVTTTHLMMGMLFVLLVLAMFYVAKGKK
ncbi:hypothetical protein [Vibrio diabolicus]|uniref:hypothetical protein n=1 Tax=Vibrio diabolicus TaxID=50719 RepID=UPI00211B57ED|nr:hypothetical protein [Vibrio diabolicus]